MENNIYMSKGLLSSSKIKKNTTPWIWSYSKKTCLSKILQPQNQIEREKILFVEAKDIFKLLLKL